MTHLNSVSRPELFGFAEPKRRSQWQCALAGLSPAASAPMLAAQAVNQIRAPDEIGLEPRWVRDDSRDAPDGPLERLRNRRRDSQTKQLFPRAHGIRIQRMQTPVVAITPNDPASAQSAHGIPIEIVATVEQLVAANSGQHHPKFLVANVPIQRGQCSIVWKVRQIIEPAYLLDGAGDTKRSRPHLGRAEVPLLDDFVNIAPLIVLRFRRNQREGLERSRIGGALVLQVGSHRNN